MAPNAADWLEAISTAVAAVGTVGTLVATVVVLRRQVDDRARGQASHVSVGAAAPINLFHSPAVLVHNNSEKAITHIAVTVVDAPHFSFADESPGVLLGGGETSIGVRTAIERLMQLNPQLDHRRLEVRVHFNDEAGRRWERDAYSGRLSRVAEPGKPNRLRLRWPNFIADRWRSDIRR